MFLKRLEVSGFKSFAEKMNIEFVSGVTAVVGPNGSGKSNISDGIRWVLGEQSARSLRGSKMEDIIFAGSDTRKPLNMAEVTLVLNNEDEFLDVDYSEVSITRRLFRSGDSEYLINNQPCRLKDITTLFMDSGLGKEAFSIIGQGKVEEVLSSKPEERRSIFEEAAGVLKYKQRKTKANKKLTETEENLNRVEDILHELEYQREPMEIQASIAKDYLAKKEELEKVEVALTVEEIKELHGEWEQAKQEASILEEKEEKAASLAANRELKVKSARENIQLLDGKLSHLQEELLTVSKALEKEEGRRELLKEKGKNITDRKKELEERFQSQQEKAETIRTRIVEEETELEKRQRSTQKISADLKETETQLQLNERDIEKELEESKAEYIELLNEQAALRNEKRYVAEQKELLKSRLTRLSKENEDFLQERDSFNKVKAEAQLEEEKALKVVQSLTETFRELTEEQALLEEKAEEKEGQLFKAYRYIQETRSRKKVLEEMETDFSGFYQGVKSVLKERGRKLSGIEGAVAELIQVPKPYETAVEIALGASLQHIVVKEESHARQAIEFLKSSRQGRATFLPLSAIQGRYLSGELLGKVSQNPGFIGIGADLIDTNSEYKKVIQSLLGQVVIAETLEDANQMAKKTGYRVRIVTLDGDIVNPGGSMTGGSVNKNSARLLGRQRELEELRSKLSDMEKKTEKAEQTVKEIKKKLKEKNEKLINTQKEMEEKRTILQEARDKRARIEGEAHRFDSRLSLYDRESKSVKEEKRTLETREATLQTKEIEVADLLAGLEKDIAEKEHKQKEKESSADLLKERLTELKVNLASHREKITYQKQKIKELREEEEKTKNSVQKVQEELAFINERLQAMSSGSGDINQDIDETKMRKKEITNHVSALQAERKESYEQVQELEESLRVNQREVKRLSGVRHEKQVEMNRLDVQLDHCLTRLQQEYEISFEKASRDYELKLSMEKAREQVNLIKLGIEELGNVNLGAIEEFERISERFEFLTEQREDLMSAKDTLSSVIQEMDEEMRRRFQETFQAIQKNFKETFCELFGGGEADLVLTQPEDLLETGIDIIARPPGKKLQHLTLLSGGEKALTAIALLFSILKVKPVPFCVLDEVEAALDEANVARFSQYLKTFSEGTQFIVVTHRKATMEEADVLYGITMEESGVSKMVSVKLEQADQLIEPVHS
ncbi:chromosome segregation protein SMC [Bacillus sp. FJAT-44742]|uniref:chromosome segregation protein SMC n=1 Tax=Bacillus sp. FJAT-44742 TaxID=2014005 RepID=UPI000C2509F4|nr:chromosome segregation protein SMC [Bacillus sp. FJAT-44742]